MASFTVIEIRVAKYIPGMPSGALVLVVTASLIFSIAGKVCLESLPVFLLHQVSPLPSGHLHGQVFIMSDKAVSQPPPFIQLRSGTNPSSAPIFSLDELADVGKQHLKR